MKMTKAQVAKERKRQRMISKLGSQIFATILELEKVADPIEIIEILERKKIAQIGRYTNYLIHSELDRQAGKR